MTDEPKFRYARINDSGAPRPTLDVPKPMTLNQFLKVNHAPWLLRLHVAAVIAFCKIFGKIHYMKPVTMKPVE